MARRMTVQSDGVRSMFFGFAGETGLFVTEFDSALPMLPQPPAPRLSLAPPRRSVLATLAPGKSNNPPSFPLPARTDFML